MTEHKACNCSQCPAFRRECEGCNQPCKYSQCDGHCDQCPVRCGRRDDLDEWLESIGGLTLDASLRPQPRFHLSGYFPQLLNGLEVPSVLARESAVGVGIDKVLTSKGEVSRRARPYAYSPYDLWVQWGLSYLSRLICVGNYLDAKLEKLWSAQLRDPVWLKVRTLGFEFATSLNFSIYLDEPRMEHLLNVKRTWLTVARMQQTSSLIPIPHLQWATLLDLRRQLDYAQEQGFHTLTMNLQLVKRQGWDTVAAGIPIIQEQVHREQGRTRPELRLLFTGVAGLKRMAELAEAFPNASFTNTTAHYLAQRYTQLARDGRRLIKTPVEGHPDLILAENVCLYRGFLAEINGRGQPAPRPVPLEEEAWQAACREVTAALQERFGFAPAAADDAFDLLATDEAVWQAFEAWLHDGDLDRDFGGSFPTWPCSDGVPHPTLGQLLDEGADPVAAFLYLGYLARQVDEEIEVQVGRAGY